MQKRLHRRIHFHPKERLLLLASNLWFLGEGMFGPLLAVFAERLDGDVLDIAWAWAAYLIASGALSYVFGKISDVYISKERLVFVGYILKVLFTFGYLLVDNQVGLLVVQVGLGLANAVSEVPWVTLYSKYADHDHDGETWGIADGQGEIITGVAILLGGVIVTYTSFSTLFIIMGLTQLAATYVVSQLLMKRVVT